VVVPLLVGALVYVAWRTTDVRLVTWLPSSLVLTLRTSIGKLPLPGFLLGSAPDLAWGWAFGAAMGLVWRDRPLAKAKASWLGAASLVAAWAEVGQLWQLPPGRFDPIDLASIVLGYAIGAFLTSRPTPLRSTPSPRPHPHDCDQSATPSTRG